MIAVASWAFVAGAISMPICCLIMAHFPRTQLLFGVPVLSLLLGGALTVLILAKGLERKESAQEIGHDGHVSVVEAKP
jgi:hypothetical protein